MPSRIDLYRLLGRTFDIRVLDPQDELAAMMACKRPAKQRRPRRAEVQHAGRTGSDSSADGGHRVCA